VALENPCAFCAENSRTAIITGFRVAVTATRDGPLATLHEPALSQSQRLH